MRLCRVSLVCLSLLSGCSSAGTINGTRLDATPASDHPQICADYEWLCIGAGIAVVGGAIWALQESHGGSEPD
jgi:hypothetical protein